MNPVVSATAGLATVGPIRRPMCGALAGKRKGA